MHADQRQLLGQRVRGIVELFQFQNVMPTDDHKQIVIGNAGRPESASASSSVEQRTYPCKWSYYRG